MYIRRYLEDVVLKCHRTFKIVYLGGSRQTGKTTLLKHLSQQAGVRYVSLDDFKMRTLAQEDPELFLQNHPPPLLIDEVQYAPLLFTYLKLRVDAIDKNGQYWLIGSQQFALMQNLQESLAGRVAVLNLLGFSFAETHKITKNKKAFLPNQSFRQTSKAHVRDIFRTIIRGSFPALYHKRPPDAEQFYNSYVQTYLDRDLRDIFHVTKISAFRRFLQLCAARTGQMLNYAQLAKDADISVHAAREWISILESTMHIYLLKPYYRNISKRLIKAPKLYFLDTGLAAYLTNWKSAETLAGGAMAGAFFETFVVAEIIKSYLYRGQRPPLYYFRDKEGHEIDLLFEQNNVLSPAEIKMGIHVKSTDMKHVEYFRKKFPRVGNGVVISLSNESYSLNRFTEVIPITSIS